MTLLRRSLVLLGVILATSPIIAQQSIEKLLQPYSKTATRSSDAIVKFSELRLGEGPIVLNDADLRALKEHAEYYVFRITQPNYYTTPATELRARTTSQTLDSLFSDLAASFSIPGTSQPSPQQAVFLKEYGVALNNAITLVMKDKNPPPILRINAARMLATASKLGTPDLCKTIIALLEDKFYTDLKQTPPEVLYYTLKASVELLAAYDSKRNWIQEPELVKLVGLLIDIVEKGPPILSFLKMQEESQSVVIGNPAQKTEPLDPKKLSPEHINVVQFYRIQAIRALGQIKEETVGGQITQTKLRPIWSIARIAIGDPRVYPPASAKEVGEAVIGLCNQTTNLDLSTSELAYAISQGIYLFATPKSANTGEDELIQWQVAGARLREALNQWKTINTKNFRLSDAEKQLCSGLVDAVNSSILEPLKQASSETNFSQKVDAASMKRWQAQQKPTGILFKNTSNMKLVYPTNR